MNKTTRIINAFAIISLLFLLLTGFAAGTPVEISTFAELMAINDSTTNLSLDYVLMNDIDAEFEVFAPIGSETNPFTGTFDGKGNTISNLTFINPTASYVGLFGNIDGASISNLSLENVNFEGNSRVGGFVGNMTNSEISNSHVVTGKVKGHTSVGGFVGNMIHSNISNSYSMTEEIIGIGGGVGGFGGQIHQSSEISNSYAMIREVEGRANVGGFVGWMATNSKIFNSYATGEAVKGDGTDGHQLGGFVGLMQDSFISNSYSTTEEMEGITNIGGFVGYMDSSSVSNSYSIGNASGTSNVGGFTGVASPGSIEDSFYIGTANAPGSLEGIQVTPAELKQIDTFTVLNPTGYVSAEWNVSSTLDPNFIWYVDEDNDYPRFYWETTYTVNFDTDGGIPIPADQTVFHIGVASQPSEIPVKTGHTFVEWQEVISGTTYNFADPVTSNVDLIAIYDIITYTVTFDSDSGTTVPNQVINHGSAVVEPANPTKTGYTFVEWQEVISGTTYNFADPVISNVDLIAIYTVNPSGGGGGSGTGSATITNNTGNNGSNPQNTTPALDNTTQNITPPQQDTPVPVNVVEPKTTTFPWLLLLIGAILSIFIFFIILYKNRKDNDEKNAN